MSHDLRITDPLKIPKLKAKGYGIHFHVYVSLGFYGPKKWISLSHELKSFGNTENFINLVKNWFIENKCQCSFC